MFGETYKIPEEEVDRLARRARLRTRIIFMSTILIALTFVKFALPPANSSADYVPFIVVVPLAIFIALKRQNLKSFRKTFESYELTISEGTVSCNSSQIKPTSINTNEITTICYFIKGGILIKGKDIYHAFVIPKQIEKLDEVIAHLNNIRPIEDGKTETRKYWMRTVLHFFTLPAIVGVLLINDKFILIPIALFNLFYVCYWSGVMLKYTMLSDRLKFSSWMMVVIMLLATVLAMLKIFTNYTFL